MRAETESILRKKRRFEIEKCGGNRKSEKMRKCEKTQNRQGNFCTEVGF